METSEPPELNVDINADARRNFDLNVPLDFRDPDEASDPYLGKWDTIVIPLPDCNLSRMYIALIGWPHYLVQLPSFGEEKQLKHPTILDKCSVFYKVFNQCLESFSKVLHIHFQKIIFFCIILFVKMLSLFYWLQEQFFKMWQSLDHTRCVINTCARFTHHDECWGFTSAGEWLRMRCMHNLIPVCVCSVLL